VKVKISLYRACGGGYVGGGHIHPALLDAAREGLADAKEKGLVADGFVARCGDHIDLVLLHDPSGLRGDARSVAREVFGRAASAGARLRQHGNGGVDLDGAELGFEPRASEPVLCFFSNKAVPGVWNLPLYRMLADPFITPGLVTDPSLREGFRFTTRSAECAEESFDLPADLYRLLASVRTGARIVEVRSRTSGEVAAVASGGANPPLLVRCEPPFPSVEDALEAFCSNGSVGGVSPLVPVSANSDASARSIPRAIGLGFQVMPDRLVGPRDLLGDAAFDDLRREAFAAARQARNGAVLTVPAREVSSPI
jgi:fructose 1,6-bisphosphate aldolase/phosphatase